MGTLSNMSVELCESSRFPLLDLLDFPACAQSHRPIQSLRFPPRIGEGTV
jgi:hypothetical protein